MYLRGNFTRLTDDQVQNLLNVTVLKAPMKFIKIKTRVPI